MTQLFINLPVQDMEKSRLFYSELGFTLNPLYTGNDQTCMVLNERVYVMLQSRNFSNSYIKKPLADNRQSLSATFTIPLDSPEEVNAMADKGLKAGGTEPAPPLDEGYMQLRAVEDPDGFIWTFIYINKGAFLQQKKMDASS